MANFASFPQKNSFVVYFYDDYMSSCCQWRADNGCYDIPAKHLLSQEEISNMYSLLYQNWRKETVSRDFCLLFFIKQFLLVPLDMPRQDSDFCRIIVALFIFVIDYPVYSPPKSRNSWVCSSLGSQDPPMMNKTGCRPKLLWKTPRMITWLYGGVVTPCCIRHHAIFFTFLMLVTYRPGSRD